MEEVRLPRALLDSLRPHLPEVSAQAVSAIMDEVPVYNRALEGPMGDTITNAVLSALDGFLLIASRNPDRGTMALAPVVKGAYLLGAAESRSGRTIEALLAAYRIGARVSWQELSGAALAAGATAEHLARLAGLVFSYIDELSANSVTGHHDQEESSGRVLRQRLDRLGQSLLRGEQDAVEALIERTDWRAPRTLTAVLLPHDQVRAVMGLVPGASLHPTEAPAHHPERSVLLVAGTGSRTSLLSTLSGRRAIVGPTRPWSEVRGSYLRAVRGLAIDHHGADEPIDTEAHLPRLVVTADPEALADLRRRALAPLDGQTAASREKLIATLRSWLLHLGRRDAVAADLFVHAQTVRYRMGQLRELYGDALDDPAVVEELVLALTAPDATLPHPEGRPS